MSQRSCSEVALKLLLLCFCLECGDTLDLKYALFTSGQMGGFDSSGAVPAIQIAQEMINSNTTILPGYNLTHTPVVDARCDRTRSLDEYFRTVPSPNPTVLGLLGCGCSVATMPVAEIVQHNSISQIGYASSSIELTDRDRFPNFFRTYASDADFTPAIIAVIKYYGWKRVAFLTQEEALFVDFYDKLMDRLEALNINVKNRLIPSEIPIRMDSDFFFEKDDFRVFFLNTYSDIGRQIICEAYKRRYIYPRYAWLTYGWYENRWWMTEINPQPANCTDNDFTTVLERALALQIFPVANDSDAMTDTGLTPNQFEVLYHEKLASPEAIRNNYTNSFVATVAFDALWTLALALDQTDRMIRNESRAEILQTTECRGEDMDAGVVWDLVALENFSYLNELMGCVIKWNLEKTDFVGISGSVLFNSVGSRVQSQVKISQYRHVGDIMSTTFHRVSFGFSQMINETNSFFVYRENESNDTVYPQMKGGIPPDGSPVTVVNTYHLALVTIYYCLTVLGLIFCTVCLVFNFTYRNRKVIRLTSPNLNYFIILGCYITYFSIFFRIMPSTDYGINVARCNIDTFVNTVGYSLAYGSILVKMGRIYHIFHNPGTSKKTLKDWHLILIILGVTAGGGLIALILLTVPTLKPIPYLGADDEYGVGMNEFGVRITYMVYLCFGPDNSIQTAFLFIVFAYLLLLQIIGIILAIQTRKVKIKLLNDSKYIAALIYISSIILVLITIVTFAIGNLINVIELVYSGGLLIATTAFLSLLFIPKMVSLHRDPDGELIFDKADHGTTGIFETSLKVTKLDTIRKTADNSKVLKLESRIVELESLLKNYQHTREYTADKTQTPINSQHSSDEATETQKTNMSHDDIHLSQEEGSPQEEHKVILDLQASPQNGELTITNYAEHADVI